MVTNIEIMLDELLEKGRSKGIEEGREETKKEVARVLLSMGEPVMKIALATKLTEEEIKKIQKTLNN